jgi:hypothetical protein
MNHPKPSTKPHYSQQPTLLVHAQKTCGRSAVQYRATAHYPCPDCQAVAGHQVSMCWMGSKVHRQMVCGLCTHEWSGRYAELELVNGLYQRIRPVKA